MLDPRHLRVLIEVARTGSYAGAARALGYTQPAIGQQIATLERRLRTPVVYRSGRQVHLTEAGEILVQRAHAILSSIQAAEDDIASLVGVQRGSARVLLSGTALRLLAPCVLSSLRDTRPGLRISVSQAHPRVALEAVRAGEAEIGVVFTLPSDQIWSRLGSVATGHLDESDLEGVAQFPLFRDSLVILVPASHRLAKVGHARLGDLERETMIAGGLMPVAQSLAIGVEAAQPTVATTNLLAMHDLIAAGFGLAAVASTVVRDIASKHVVGCPVVPKMSRSHIAITMGRLTNVPAVRLCLEALQSAAAELRSSDEAVE